MIWRRSIARVGAVLALLGFSPLPALAQPVAQAQTLVIGVDHSDPANQQPEQHRVWEYTDFFTRTVTVHTGDTIDFRTAPDVEFHVVGLAPDAASALAAYPVGGNDTDDPVEDSQSAKAAGAAAARSANAVSAILSSCGRLLLAMHSSRASSASSCSIKLMYHRLVPRSDETFCRASTGLNGKALHVAP